MKKLLTCLMLLQIFTIVRVYSQPKLTPPIETPVNIDAPNASYLVRQILPTTPPGNGPSLISYARFGIFTCGFFKFYYDTTQHFGFNDPVNGASYRQTVCDAATYIASVIQIPASVGYLEIDLNNEIDSSKLYVAHGAAYVNHTHDRKQAIYEGGLLYDHIINGTDTDSTQHDALVGVNFYLVDPSFHFSGCRVTDLFPVLVHELTHGLGFISLTQINPDTTQVVSGTDSSKVGNYSLLDKYFLYVLKGGTFTKLVTGNTTPVLDPSIVPADLKSNSVWLTNDPIGNKTNIPISSEATFALGTTLSHFDDWYDIGRNHDSPGFVPNHMMSPYEKLGVQTSKYTVTELKVLQTIGYTLNPAYPDYALLSNHTPYVDGNVIAPLNNFPYDETGVGLSPKLDLGSINSCQTITIDLGARSELHDADGDPIRIFPNSLYGIRGCGNNGNNHTQLTIDSTGGTNGSAKITFTPRHNFLGRVQFGFHLYDGKARGAFVVYTITVTKNKTCFSNTGNEMVINKGMEEGNEYYTDTHTTTEFNILWARSFLRSNNSAPFLPVPVCAWAIPHLDGAYLEYPNEDLKTHDQYKPCEYGDAYYAIPGAPLGINSVDGSNRYLAHVGGEEPTFLLSDTALSCHRYVLNFDAAQSNTGTATFQLSIGTDFSIYTDQKVKIHTFTIPDQNTWHHYTYSFTVPDTNLAFTYLSSQLLTNTYLYLDNISLMPDLAAPPLTVDAGNDIAALGPVVIGGSPTAQGGTPPYTYKWTPNTAFVGSSTIANPTVNPAVTTVYTVEVTDSTRCFHALDSMVVYRSYTTCGHFFPADHILGTKGKESFNQAQIIDMAGATRDFNGDYLVWGEVTFRNGTFNINPGSNFYILGRTRDPGPNIEINNATLNINNATLQAVCDTMWGSILNNDIIPSGHTTCTNQLNISGNSVISDAFEAISFDDEGDNPNLKAHYNIQHTKFMNCHTAIYDFKTSTDNSAAATDYIVNCTFDSDIATNKFPDKNRNANAGLILTYVHSNTKITNNNFGHLEYGIVAYDMLGTIGNNSFNNTYLRGITANYFAPNDHFRLPTVPTTLTIISDTFNLPVTYPAYLGANAGKTTGLYISNTPSFHQAEGNNLNAVVANNDFNGSPAAGITHTGFANSIFSLDGYALSGNTFTNTSAAINNLNFMSTTSIVEQNTFTACPNSIFTAGNNGQNPHCNVRCNTFNRGPASGIFGINIPSTGVLTDVIGNCALNQTAGNSFVGFDGINGIAIQNQNPDPSRRITYNRSITEALTGNPGAANTTPAAGVLYQCMLTSGCPVGHGLPLITQLPIRPTLVQVLLAIQQLVNNLLLPLQNESKLIGTVLGYYNGNCGPDYQNVVNSMLPNNLTAYTALAWNLTECYLGQGNVPAALSLMQQINYQNPGNLEVIQRTNFYTVMLRLQGLTTYTGYKASIDDINVLAAVAASGTEFSAAACYALLPIAPDRTAGCFSIPTNPAHGRLGDTNGQDNTGTPANGSAIVFTNVPNPFTESTKVGYVLPANTQQAVLMIYDIQGKRVKTIPLNVQDSEIPIYADDMANGVYLYSITADGTTATPKRMVVIK